MERRFNIEAFRNIGFQNEEPRQEGLILNNSLYKEKIGDLVILIGPNNSGKSNVLDALECFANSSISNRDKTDLFMEPKMRNPQLTFSSKNEEIVYSCRLFADNNTNLICSDVAASDFKINNYLPAFSNSNDFINQNQQLSDLQMSYLEIVDFPNYLDSCVDYSSHHDDIIQKACESIIGIVDTMKNVGNNYKAFKNVLVNRAPSYYNFLVEYENYKANNRLDIEKVNNEYRKRYEMNFIPKIVRYKEKLLSNDDLVSSYEKIKNNLFFRSLFNNIKFDFDTLTNTFNTYREQNNRGILTQLEKKLNKKIKTISDRFNKMYYIEENTYSFDIKLESNEISFSIFRGEQAISLNYQSTGFRWFFDLFFNIFSADEFKAGDIIIMDEPATNLHVKGQEELRAFLKEYAIRSGITFIIATHSPFLIDMDYLDELRIISNKNNITCIDNDFSAINLDDPDSLLPVKESLTVRNSILIDPDQFVVFVEGITDYNYLVAMKKALGYENITFLPIKGVGKTKEQQMEISKRLLQIRKHNPTLIVDGDKAGKEMKNTNKESDLTVVCLKDVNEKFGEIESLFSNEDLIKFNLIDDKGKPIKHASTSSIFKKTVLMDNTIVSKETMDNFKQLFDKLID